MQPSSLHKFQIGERRFVIDPSTCFCFECDHISWDVLEYYPYQPLNRIYHLLQDKHPRKELEEVVGELEWLRVTKAILAPPKDEALMGEAADAQGLEKITVVATGGATPLEERLAAAGNALLAASASRNNLTLQLALDDQHIENPEAIAHALCGIKQAARFAEKKLRVVCCSRFSARGADGAAQYSLEITLREDADIAAGIRAVVALSGGRIKKVASTLKQEQHVSTFRIVARPNNERFHSLLKELYDAGFHDILLDMPGAYAANPQLEPAAVAEALRANAAWYAEQLLQQRYFRAEPFATLFDAVHQGRPVRRADGAGCWELAVDDEGRVFPSLDFLGEPRHQIGALFDGRCESDVKQIFENVSAARMPVCLQCWARCLCGGGHAVIHYRRTGNPNTPDPRWCDGQRLWLAHVIDAFNTLTTAGVNFSHIVGAMRSGGEKMSWLQAAKTAYQMRLIPRPLQENDAEWLVKWENWNDAAYFTCNESGLLLATRYDREMDALHPRGIEQELVLTRHNGAPCGLLKTRPAATLNGFAWVWLYMRDKSVYAESGARRALRALLTETSHSQNLRRILIPVTAAEPDLASCLEALGFKQHGIQRQALYLHGVYHDILIYSYEPRTPGTGFS